MVEIVEDGRADYAPKEVPSWDAEAGGLAPAWRWDLRDRSVYPRRSVTTQYDRKLPLIPDIPRVELPGNLSSQEVP